jgi:hypothetical protein
MKRTSYSIPLALATVVFVLSAAVAVNAQNREKFVISAKAGGVNAISGRAEIRSQHGTEWQLLSITDDMKTGDVVKTGSDGRVEMLLNPGSYLRVAENSEFELTDGSLNNLEVRLSRGTAIIEATGAESTELMINISTPDARMAIVRSGLYRLNVVPGDATELIVRKGRVLLDNAQTKVKAGNRVVFTRNTFFVAKLRKSDQQQDSLENWSKHRAETLAQANRKIPGREANLFLASSFDYWNAFSASSSGLWFFNPAFRCFTFLPFQFGWGSPYGGSYSGIFYYGGYHCCGWNPYRPVFGGRTEEAPGWGRSPGPSTGVGSTGSTGNGSSGGRSSSPSPPRAPELPIGRGKPDTNPDNRPRAPQ